MGLARCFGIFRGFAVLSGFTFSGSSTFTTSVACCSALPATAAGALHLVCKVEGNGVVGLSCRSGCSCYCCWVKTGSPNSGTSKSLTGICVTCPLNGDKDFKLAFSQYMAFCILFVVCMS